MIIIGARSKNGVIGIDRGLPWFIPEDLNHFKNTTEGHIVIMGQTTFESLGEKPLGNRLNVVMTRQVNPLKVKGVTYCKNIEEVLTFCKQHPDKESFVIGGSSIFKTFMALADSIIVTTIQKIIPGDRYFPTIFTTDWSLQDQITSSYIDEVGAEVGLIYEFYERIED